MWHVIALTTNKERGNRSTRGKTSWSKEENQQQTQPTFDAKSRNRINPGHIAWEANAQPLRPGGCQVRVPGSIHSLSHTISTLICIRSVFFLRRTRKEIHVTSTSTPGPGCSKSGLLYPADKMYSNQYILSAG